MSRSTNVYTVHEVDGPGVLAAFTVKHELVTWLRHEKPLRPISSQYWKVLRHSDGRPHLGADVLNIAELLS